MIEFILPINTYQQTGYFPTILHYSLSIIHYTFKTPIFPFPKPQTPANKLPLQP